MHIQFAVMTLFLSSSVCADVAEAPASALPLFIVHFETGQNWDESLGANEQIQFAEHSKNLQELRRSGTIVFGARYGELGVIILRHDSLQTATKLIAADPGVQSGIFVFRIETLSVFYNWQD